MSNKVNLMIIGSQKSGTTSLYEYMKQHPNIYFSEVKEVTYFTDDLSYKKGELYFHSYFKKYVNEKIIASSDVHILPSKEAPIRIKKYNRNMKFIIVLREPVSRAYSAYNYAIKNSWEDSRNSFLDTIGLENDRVRDKKYNLMYFENGKYYKHITYWYKFFPEKNF